MVYRIQTHWITVSNRTSGRHWTNWRETCRCFPFLALRIHDNHAGYGDCNGILWGKWTVSEESVSCKSDEMLLCFYIGLLKELCIWIFSTNPWMVLNLSTGLFSGRLFLEHHAPMKTRQLMGILPNRYVSTSSACFIFPFCLVLLSNVLLSYHS